VKKGFTLIELLVVITIIAILATVIVVNLSSAQIKAKESAAESNIEQISNAAEIIKIEAGTFAGSKYAKGLVTGNTGADVAIDITLNSTVKSPTDYTASALYTLFIDSGNNRLFSAAPAVPSPQHIYWQTDGTVSGSPAVIATSDSGKYVIYTADYGTTTNWITFKSGKVCTTNASTNTAN